MSFSNYLIAYLFDITPMTKLFRMTGIDLYL